MADTQPPPEAEPNHPLLADTPLPPPPPPRQSAPVRPGGGGGGGAPPPPIDLPIIKYLNSKRVILASASPRRRALLGQIGLRSLEIIASTKPENLDKDAYGPEEYVAATARQKCLDVYENELRKAVAGGDGGGNGGKVNGSQDPDVVIAADTVIVTRAGRILEKPRNEDEHVRMLKHLRDTVSHRVVTAVCVVAPRRDLRSPGYALATAVEQTTVVFVQDGAAAADADGDGDGGADGNVDGDADGGPGLNDDVIRAYVRTREGADKAGGYALQGVGGLLLVDRVEGSVDNVIGLPVRRTLALAEKAVFRQDDLSDDEEEGEEGG